MSIPAATLDAAPLGLSLVMRRGGDLSLLALTKRFCASLPTLPFFSVEA